MGGTIFPGHRSSGVGGTRRNVMAPRASVQSIDHTVSNGTVGQPIPSETPDELRRPNRVLYVLGGAAIGAAAVPVVDHFLLRDSLLHILNNYNLVGPLYNEIAGRAIETTAGGIAGAGIAHYAVNIFKEILGTSARLDHDRMERPDQ